MAKLTIPSEEYQVGGHAACPGCGAALAMRYLLKGLGPQAVVVIPACCWAVIPGAMPGTCLRVSTVFSSFESTAAMASGLKAGLRQTGRGDVPVVGFAGDGGTADIGIQALSGAAERNEDFLYVCYDNEAYMNTGIQRSGSTPAFSLTTTTPRGLEKHTPKKDLPMILDAHHIPYIATLNPSFPEDFVAKATKAARFKGTRYLHVLADCPTGWKHDPSQMVEVGRLATLSHYWPLFEIDQGRLRITWSPSNPIPVEKYLRSQGRFKNVTPEEIAQIQQTVDERWHALQERASRDQKSPERIEVPSETPASPVPHSVHPVSETVIVHPSEPFPSR